MFNWKPNEPRDEWRELVEERLCKCESDYAAKYNDLKVTFERDRADLWKAIKDLSEAANKPAVAPDLTKVNSRLEDFEMWRAKIHNLITEKSLNTGKEKLSKVGNTVARFYGKA